MSKSLEKRVQPKREAAEADASLELVFSVRIPSALRRQIKIAAAKANVQIRDFVRAALEKAVQE